MPTRETVYVYRRRGKGLDSDPDHENENVQEAEATEITLKGHNAKGPTRRNGQFSWIGRCLSSRSSTNTQGACNFSSSQCTKGETKPLLLSPNAHRKKRVEAPANFVQEQKNYFAQVDAFELEEESPPSKERWMHKPHQKDHVQVYRRGLQVVQEDTLEHLLDEKRNSGLPSCGDPFNRIFEICQSHQGLQNSVYKSQVYGPNRGLREEEPSDGRSSAGERTLFGIRKELLNRKPVMVEQPASCKPLSKSVESIIVLSDDENESLLQLGTPQTLSNLKGLVRKPQKQEAGEAMEKDGRAQNLPEVIILDVSPCLLPKESTELCYVASVTKESNKKDPFHSVVPVKRNDLSTGSLSIYKGEDSHRSTGSTHCNDYSCLHQEIETVQMPDEGCFGPLGIYKPCRIIKQPTARLGSPPCIKEQISSFEALLRKCGQKAPLQLKEAILEFSDMSNILKLGEGTYGEAFRASDNVIKIVPMDGKFQVNGEVQKTSAEMCTEMLLALTLNRLNKTTNGLASKHNLCSNFIQTKMVKVCQGIYDPVLITAWEDWDTKNGSENDHPKVFPESQLYMLFVLGDGGQDLERFSVSSFAVARSILTQVSVALAIAEEDCEFEHRDLHWGNILVAHTGAKKLCCKLDGKDMHIDTCGVFVHIIDFTLSRVHTGKEILFSNLSDDPLLFRGPKGDLQSDVYRKMLHLTKGQWDKRFLKTNCFWIHYLVDTLLTKKKFPILPPENRAFRALKKRILSYDSAKALLEDEFFASIKT